MRVFLGPLLAAERVQGSDYLGRPLGYFVFAQGSFGGLELGAQQHGVFARGDRGAPEDLDWTELAQLRDGGVVRRSLYLLEGQLVGENEGEVTFNGGIFGERSKLPGAGRFVQLLEIDFSQEDILP